MKTGQSKGSETLKGERVVMQLHPNRPKTCYTPRHGTVNATIPQVTTSHKGTSGHHGYRRGGGVGMQQPPNPPTLTFLCFKRNSSGSVCSTDPSSAPPKIPPPPHSLPFRRLTCISMLERSELTVCALGTTRKGRGGGGKEAGGRGGGDSGRHKPAQLTTHRQHSCLALAVT